MSLIFLILNITSAIFCRPPKKRSYRRIKACGEEKSTLRTSHFEALEVYNTTYKEGLMDKLTIRKVAVLGSGVMGAQIAALFANAGFIVYLYDLVVDKNNPNKIVKEALKRLQKLKPAPLGDVECLNHIFPMNYEHDLEKLSTCDLVIEAIAERMDWKESLYIKVFPFINDTALFASNTSGLSINTLSKILPENLKARFCGIHFFNPPRYMSLVELTPNQKTSKDVLNYLESFLTTKLGKQVVRAKDTPNFIANRIGVFSMLSIFYHMKRLSLAFDEVDALTGTLIGHAKSATFRTLDVVGLDTMAHVIATMTEKLTDDPWHAFYQLPDWLKMLIDKGAIGQKAGCGVYQKKGKTILVLDLETGEYRESDKTINDTIKSIFEIKDPETRFTKLANTEDKQAQFLWAIYCDLFQYAAYHATEIASTIRDIDMAMRFGFGWSEGPFETWQKAGWQSITGLIDVSIKKERTMSDKPLPEWVLQCHDVYHQDTAYSPENNSYFTRSDLLVYQRQLFPVRLLNETKTISHILFENDGVKLWALDNQREIAILSFKSKKNTFNYDVMTGVIQAVQYAQKHVKAMVVWQDKGEHFSYGADLAYFSEEIKKDPAEAMAIVKLFQDMCLSIRYANIPVIVAVRGLVLGGGCELMMHADCRVAAFESYIGLVEAGVGLLPAGGGSKEFVYKAFLHDPKDPMKKLADYFKQLAMAEVSNSALDAKKRGFLAEEDSIVMHNDEILYVALAKAKVMSEVGYEPPVPPKIKVLGDTGIATFKSQLVNMREGNFISDYDYFLASKIAEVLCGGAVTAMSEVDETWLLACERNAFIELAQQEKTQARIKHTLITGKPLRN